MNVNILANFDWHAQLNMAVKKYANSIAHLGFNQNSVNRKAYFLCIKSTLFYSKK